MKAAWADIINGSHFFENDAGENGTVNGDRYCAMITDYLMLEIEGRNHGDMTASLPTHCIN